MIFIMLLKVLGLYWMFVFFLIILILFIDWKVIGKIVSLILEYGAL